MTENSSTDKLGSQEAPESTNTDEVVKIVDWVHQLKDSNLRVNALIELSRKREAFTDLAIYLWYTPGVISAL